MLYAAIGLPNIKYANFLKNLINFAEKKNSSNFEVQKEII